MSKATDASKTVDVEIQPITDEKSDPDVENRASESELSDTESDAVKSATLKHCSNQKSILGSFC
jgi:hypothetical protein